MNRKLQRPKVFASTLLLLLFFHAQTLSAAAPQPLDLKVRADQLLKQGQRAQAVSLYERVLEQDPGFANAYYNLATAYYLQGEIEKGSRNLEVFVKLRPQDAEALYNLGCLKIRLGNFNEAMKCFLKAVDCPCSRLISQKIKEALRFTKDLRHENPETQKLLAYLLTGSAKTLFSAAD